MPSIYTAAAYLKLSQYLLGQPVDDCCTFLYRANEIVVIAVSPSTHPRFGTLFLPKFEMLALSVLRYIKSIHYYYYYLKSDYQ